VATPAAPAFATTERAAESHDGFLAVKASPSASCTSPEVLEVAHGRDADGMQAFDLATLDVRIAVPTVAETPTPLLKHRVHLGRIIGPTVRGRLAGLRTYLPLRC
jgi:hypothetical protein